MSPRVPTEEEQRQAALKHLERAQAAAQAGDIKRLPLPEKARTDLTDRQRAIARAKEQDTTSRGPTTTKGAAWRRGVVTK